MLKNIINCWINPKPKWKKEKTQTLNKIKYSRSTANKTQPNQTKKKNHSLLERQWMGTLSSGGGVVAQRLSSEEGREKEMKLQFSPF